MMCVTSWILAMQSRQVAFIDMQRCVGESWPNFATMHVA